MKPAAARKNSLILLGESNETGNRVLSQIYIALRISLSSGPSGSPFGPRFLLFTVRNTEHSYRNNPPNIPGAWKRGGHVLTTE